jgi:hypothetical protein
VLIILAVDKEDHKHLFEEVVMPDVVMCVFCLPYENNMRIFIFTGLRFQ